MRTTPYGPLRQFVSRFRSPSRSPLAAGDSDGVVTRSIVPRHSMRWPTALFAAVALAGYFLLPGAGAKDLTYSAIGVASVVCVLIGVRRHRPASSWAWLA